MPSILRLTCSWTFRRQSTWGVGSVFWVTASEEMNGALIRPQLGPTRKVVTERKVDSFSFLWIPVFVHGLSLVSSPKMMPLMVWV